MIVGERLRVFREDKKFSQADIEKKAGANSPILIIALIRTCHRLTRNNEVPRDTIPGVCSSGHFAPVPQPRRTAKDR